MKRVVVIITVLMLDVAVYLILGLMLMNYDDNYQESQGAYWSLSSMDTLDKVIYISFNAWQVVNVIGVLFIGYWLVKKPKRATTKPMSDAG